MGGGTCYDLVNAYVCFCPDRVFRPQCNVTSRSSVSRNINRKGMNEPSTRTFCTSTQCENGGTCNQQGLTTVCRCKPGFSGPRCQTGSFYYGIIAISFFSTCLEYFRCQSNGRFTDVVNCKQGLYFECVYHGQCKLSSFFYFKRISLIHLFSR